MILSSLLLLKFAQIHIMINAKRTMQCVFISLIYIIKYIYNFFIFV